MHYYSKVGWEAQERSMSDHQNEKVPEASGAPPGGPPPSKLGALGLRIMDSKVQTSLLAEAGTGFVTTAAKGAKLEKSKKTQKQVR